jgi:hypothetical protein
MMGGLATFFVLVVAPLAWFFHRKVIKPLSFVLGLKQEDSPTGEPIASIPIQLAGLRKNQEAFVNVQTEQGRDIALIKSEVFPNHGSSLRDAVDHHGTELTEVRLQVVDLQDAISRAEADRRRVAQLAVDTATRAKNVADTAAAAVAKLAVDTAADVKIKKDLDAADLAKTAVVAATGVAQLAVDTATALADEGPHAEG